MPDNPSTIDQMKRMEGLSLMRLAEKSQPLPGPTKANFDNVPADQLISEAMPKSEPTREEINRTRIVQTNKLFVAQKAKDDPRFRQEMWNNTQGKSREDVEQYIFDKGDEIRWGLLQKDPNFSSEEAIQSAFADEITFGQMGKIMRGMYRGRKYLAEKLPGVATEPELSEDDFIDQTIEKWRLVQKFNPGQDFLGRMLAYMVPHSPVQKAFSGFSELRAAGKVAQGATKAAGKALAAGGFEKAAEAVTSKFGQKVVETGVRGGLGFMAVRAPRHFLGDGNAQLDEFEFFRGVRDTAKDGVFGTAFSAGIPVLARGVQAGIESGVPQRVARGIGEAVDSFITMGTGKKKWVMQSYVADPKGTAAYAGKESEVVNRIWNDVMSRRRVPLPEREAADKLLDQFPGVNVRSVLSKFPQSGKTQTPKIADQIPVIERYRGFLEARIKEEGFTPDNVPARILRDIVDDLQDVLTPEFGRDSTYAYSVLKSVSAEARKLVEASGKQAGEVGERYVSLMRKTAGHRKLIQYFVRQLGTNPDKVDEKALGFINRMFGPNGEIAQRRALLYDRTFGTKFAEQMEKAYVARAISPAVPPGATPSGKPGFTPDSAFTGGALALGGTAGISGAVVDILQGNVMQGVGKAVATTAAGLKTSPRVMSWVMGASNALGNVPKMLLSDPKALQAIQKMGGVPIEVKHLAKEVENALVKEGAIHAATKLRLIADTPYYIGLVDGLYRYQERAGIAAKNAMLNRMQDESQSMNPGY